MATFLAHLRIHPGREADFERTAADLWAATHRDESAVRRYEYFRGAQPGTYYTLASFDDYDGFIAHQVSEHHVGATSALRDCIADIHLEWLDPITSASGLAATNMNTPTDTSGLAASYAARQPADVQPWWQPLR